METSSEEPPPAAAPSNRSRLDVAAAVVGMIRTLTVPAVALFLIVAFFQPLSQIASILPDKFREASKMSYGSFLLEVQKSAERRGNPELATKIGDLSEPALRYLLGAQEGKDYLLSWTNEPDGSKHYRLIDETHLQSIAELESKRLYACDTPIRTWERRFLDEMKPVQEKMRRNYVPIEGVDVPSELNIGCQPTSAGKVAVSLIIGVVTSEIAAARASQKSGQEGKEAQTGD